MEAWAQTSTQVDGRQEWVHNACLNALDGSEDGQIARDLVPLWMHIGMPRIREQLREEIADEVQAGRLRSFWQYPELLEPYDEHEGLCEGMEDAEIRVHDDDADSSSDEDDVAPGRGDEQRDMEDLPDEGRAGPGDVETEARAESLTGEPLPAHPTGARRGPRWRWRRRQGVPPARSEAKRIEAMQCNATQRNAMQCTATQDDAMQGKAKQCNAMQSAQRRFGERELA